MAAPIPFELQKPLEKKGDAVLIPAAAVLPEYQVLVHKVHTPQVSPTVMI